MQNFGSIEGKIFEEVKAEAAAAGSAWPNYTPPGAETIGELGERIVSFFKVIVFFEKYTKILRFIGILRPLRQSGIV